MIKQKGFKMDLQHDISSNVFEIAEAIQTWMS
jgi:hypothetical protein